MPVGVAAMHFNSSQSRSAWTEQEDDLLRNAVGVYGERSWANVAQMVPGRSSKSCSDRWRNFLSPDIEHPRKSPFTEWEIAVVVLAQARYGNNWKAISMLLPGRTNRAVKNLFVGNLKWGARLPEIRNRFLEWSMTLESLLEIKPDRAGGPVKTRPGQLLPDGTNGASQDGSPLSGSPASTSSAGSAWQSDMTEHPNGSPGSANTSERRRRADGEMAAAAGQQSSPVLKRRRGAQSPVLGGLQHQLQSPSLAPHPGALGPSYNGVSGTGSPSLGHTMPGAMGPPANRNPSQYLGLDGMLLGKQPVGSSNGSNDGTSALLTLPPGSEATPTSDPSESGGTLTPGGALTAGLARGCFGAGGASALGLMQQPGGPRTNSMPCGGLQQRLMGGDGSMAGRVASWHYSGQMFAAGGGGILDPATAAAMAAARPASPFQQHAAQASAVAAAAIPGSLTSLLTDGSDTGAAAGAMQAASSSIQVKSECSAGAAAAAAAAASSYQMHQQHQHWMHQQHYHQQQQQYVQHQQHQQQQYAQQHHHQKQYAAHQQQMAGMVQAQHDASAAAGRDHMQQQSQQPEHQQQQQQGATTASIVASAAMELALPGSPVLAGSILQDMRSNDSAGLHSMLDQILNEDLNMADSTLALLRGSDSGLPPIAPQRSSAFDPPVITLPPLPEAPPCSQSTGYQGTAGAGPAGAAGAGAAASPSPRPQAPPPTPIGGVGAVLGGGALAAAAGGQANGMSCSSGMQMSAGQGVTQDHWGMGGIKAEQQTAQANTSGQQMHSGAYQQQQQHGQHQQLQQQQPQQQQQQMGGMPQGLPSRPGSSAGMAAQGAAMPAQSPEPAALSPNMSMLCAQLQQENMLLMHKLHQMEQHHIGGSHPAASPAPAAAAGPAAAPCGAEPSMAHIAPAIPGQPQVQQQQAPASAAGPAAAAAQPVASAGMSWGGFDALLPQLRPVLTRVGGSAGGALSAGGSLGGLCPSDLVSESPAQLINTAFLDDHGLLGGL